MARQDSFGFVDPSLVLRACHILPVFASGKRYADGIGLSTIAGDSNDWKSYYVNRFADRDMVMRFHWGLGIGHTYSHGKARSHDGSTTPTSPSPSSDGGQDSDIEEVEQDSEDDDALDPQEPEINDAALDPQQPEMDDATLEPQEPEMDDEDVDSDATESHPFSEGRDSDGSDDEYLELLDTYGED
ncbi:hypothetical protein HYPSUDRAFT_205550 [Hypholoma sublateritium FD-334 SS-4]|uniref:Uncharacterized protein n=1 Tax=Hypholoma sublateritium (strain FD-334 SS-4) TaxID=945553 RepID=A0A0D2KUA3_HYPSF|nr:hypothetical protein HYPSUDRAFT_205550 [Hypholoma sublateritium FD-334 SS-4]